MKDKRLHSNIIWYRLKFIFRRVAAIIFTLFLILNTILQTSAFQSLIAVRVSSYLSEQLDIKIEIEHVRISLMLDVMLKGVYIEDSHQNEMISIKYLYARLSAAQLMRKSFRLNEVEMVEGGFSMIKYEGERFYNYTELTGVPDTLKERNSDINFEFYCRSVKLKDCYFNMINENNPSRNGFDWNNMYLKLHKVDGRNIIVNNDSISVNIRDIVVSDTSGFRLNKFTSSMKFIDDGWYFDNTFILTPKSTLDFDFKFGYSTFDNIGYFEDSITMSADIRPSILDIHDVAYFTDVFQGLDLLTDIETKFEGTLHDFAVNDFKMNFGNQSQIKLDAQFQGILDIETALMNVRIHDLTTTWDDLSHINLPVEFFSTPPPDSLKQPVSLIALFDGSIHDFISDLYLSSSIGDLGVKMKLEWDKSLQEHTYQAMLRSTRLNIGYLANIPDILEDASFHVDISGSGLSLETANINLNALLDHFVINDYCYNDIKIDGIFYEKKFDGFLDVADNNVNLNFSGIIDLHDALPSFDFSLDLKNAYLMRLNLIKNRADDLRLSTKLTMKAKGNTIDNTIGTIRINDFEVVEDKNIYAFDSIRILSYQADTEHRNTKIESDLLEARINGNYNFSHLGNVFRQLIGNYLASVSSQSENKFDLSYHVDGYVEIKDISSVTRFFLPELNIPDGFYLEQNVDLDDNHLMIKSNSPTIVYNDIVFSDFSLHAESHSYGTGIKTGFGEISFLHKEDTTIVGIEDFIVNALIMNDSIKYSISWDRKWGELIDISYIDGIVDFQEYPKIGMNFSDMSVILRDGDSPWRVKPKNHISYDAGNITIDSLFFYASEKSHAIIDGHILKDEPSTVSLYINNWDLSIVNKALDPLGLNIFGNISGNVNISDPYADIIVDSDLTIDSLRLNHNQFGDATLKFDWKNREQVFFVDLNTVFQGKRGVTNPITFTGHYFPKESGDNIDLYMKLENFGLDILTPFVRELVSDIEGFISGEMTAKGTIEKPIVNGDFFVQRGQARILYINTLYSFNGNIIANNDIFEFRDFMLYDTLANEAKVQGGIRHKAFTNFEFDVQLLPNQFIVLNTTRFDNDAFYGLARVGGTVTFKGPFNDIKIGANVATNQNTDISIPLNMAQSISESSFVIFKQPVDSLSVEEYPNMISSSMGLSILFNVQMTPDGRVRIFFPDNIGRINANGSGNLLLSMNNIGNFEIFGDYTITSGDFFLTLSDILLNKRLVLNKGSFIRFNGDPTDADVDVSATHEVLTSLENLKLTALSNNPAAAAKRIPVNCIIRMRNKLMDPEISFSVEFPSLDESIKSEIYTRIDTTNVAEMTNQAFSLLLFGSFNNEMGDFNPGSLITSSSINMLTNQLNNLLSQTFRGIDVGFNYRGSDSFSMEDFDLFLRKGLFDDRLIIDANVGVADNYTGSSRSSMIVGDASAEVKLTEDGRWRLKAFTRSNANDISKVSTNNGYGYTYGVGVGFQKSFTTLKEVYEGYKQSRQAKREKKAAKKEKQKPAILQEEEKDRSN
ncbi:MAG: translocation/assembly module TamB [Bacteroidales bacterium]|jgi:hypothetical protein|nr:translocation/assembly module TamB [Bacteroidales bacterium]